MKTSDKIEELCAAFAKAQPEFQAADRDHRAKVETRSGGSYEFTYADFAANIDAISEPLGKYGLFYLQDAKRKGELAVEAWTRLVHASGQWIESEPLEVPIVADSRGTVTAQIVASGVTYAKRYSLTTFLGLRSESDDDGNHASGNQADIAREPRKAMPPCPMCGKNSVIASKFGAPGELYCFPKKDGCGHKWNPTATPHNHGDAQPAELEEWATQQAAAAPPPAKEPPKQAAQSAKDRTDFAKALAWTVTATPPSKCYEALHRLPDSRAAGKYTEDQAHQLAAAALARVIELTAPESDTAWDEWEAEAATAHRAGDLKFDDLCQLEDRAAAKRGIGAPTAA